MHPGQSSTRLEARLVREALAAARALKSHAIPLLVIALGLYFLYEPTLGWLANAWMNDEYYGHGILVPLLATFLAWRVRARFGAGQGAGATRAVLFLAPAILLYATAATLADPFVYSLSLIAALWGVAVYVIGPKSALPLAGPALFLLLAVPLPGLLEIGVELQKLAVWGTTKVLAVTGISFVQDNFIIQAGDLRFEVIPLCSGLSSLISILTLGTFVAGVSPLRNVSRGLLILAAVPIALAANVLRVATSIWVGVVWGPEVSQSFLHGLSSLFLFLVAFAGVLALRALLIKIEAKVYRNG
ncbi:MAG TPA: exosortase/archaeosortase family protein [Candidatus Thermoplasmatota archaeon]|nr:exosortase/archaeosortase family protein [Candidatus Thermoplasmatota archaeon]